MDLQRGTLVPRPMGHTPRQTGFERGDISPQLLRELTVQCDLELCQRSAGGAIAYLLLFQILSLGTPYFFDHRKVVALIGLALSTSVALRLVSATSVVRLGLHVSTSRRRWFLVGTYGCCISWSAFCCLTLVLYDVSWISLLMLVLTAGLASGAVTSLSPSPRVCRSYLLLMLSPTIYGVLRTRLPAEPCSR